MRGAGFLCRTHNKANKLCCSCFGTAGKDQALFSAVVGLGSGEGTRAVFVTLRFNIIESHQAEGICFRLFSLIRVFFFFPS